MNFLNTIFEIFKLFKKNNISKIKDINKDINIENNIENEVDNLNDIDFYTPKELVEKEFDINNKENEINKNIEKNIEDNIKDKNNNIKYNNNKKCIALVIGHSKKRGGAVGKLNNKKVSEFEYYNNFVKELKEYLKDLEDEYNVEFKIFKRNPNIKGYTKKMKDLNRRITKSNCSLAISFHFNAANNPNINYHKILYCKHLKKSKFLAKLLDKYFDKYFDYRDENIEGRLINNRGGAFLCLGKSYNLLIEPFFASYLQFFDNNYRENFKEAIKEFIIEILEKNII